MCPGLNSSLVTGDREQEHTMKNGSPDVPRITYWPLEDKRLDEILDLMVLNFVPDENVCRLIRNCEGGRPEDHRGWISKYLRSYDCRVCRVAVDDVTGRAVGVCINNIIAPGSPNPMAAMKETGSEACLLIDGFFCQMDGDYDIFKALGVEKALYISMATVDKAYRRQGISVQLRRQSVQLARQAGCQAAIDYATSPYTRRALTKLGFHQERFLPFRESVLASAEKVDLSGCGPEDGGGLMVCRL